MRKNPKTIEVEPHKLTEEKEPKRRLTNQRPARSHSQESYKNSKLKSCTYTEDLVQIRAGPVHGASDSEFI